MDVPPPRRPLGKSLHNQQSINMATVKLSESRRAKPTKTSVALPKNGNGEGKHDYSVRDLTLAEWGRKTIEVCEQEMPGLMAIRKKYGPQKPLKGVRVTGSLHMT